jgi:AraC-like DNA-binding protein
MTERTPGVTETADHFDLVSDVLELVRLGGSIFLRAQFRAPWAYSAPPGKDMAEVLFPGAGSLVLFHIVGEGRCWIALEDGVKHQLEQGDVVIMPYGDAHSVGFPDDAEPVPVVTLFPPPPWDGMTRLDHGGDGEPTLFICGYLEGDAALFDPVLRALPPLFVVRPTGPAAAWVSASVEYARMSPRSTPSRAAQRLPELLFTEVLRIYLESQESELTGWLAALRDPVTGPALARLHAEPAREWNVADLAGEVAVSKTVLVERFRHLVGRPPIRYLTEWRLNLASGLLRTTELGVGEIAARVGYNAEEAFSRAFKREFGKAPAHWRADATG